MDKIGTELQLFEVLEILESLRVCHGISSKSKHIRIFYDLKQKARKGVMKGNVVGDTLFSKDCKEIFKQKRSRVRCPECATYKRAFFKRIARYVPSEDVIRSLRASEIVFLIIVNCVSINVGVDF